MRLQKRNLRVSFQTSSGVVEIKRATYRGWVLAQVLGHPADGYKWEVFKPEPIRGKLYAKGILVETFTSEKDAKQFIDSATRFDAAVKAMPACVAYDPYQIKRVEDVRYVLQHEIDLWESQEDGCLNDAEISEVRTALAQVSA